MTALSWSSQLVLVLLLVLFSVDRSSSIDLVHISAGGGGQTWGKSDGGAAAATNGSSNSGPSSPPFFVAVKSAPVVARAGDTIDLSCQTSQKWHLCSWRMPKGQWCDRLSSSKYTTACFGEERIRYQRAFVVPSSQPPVDPSRDCSVTIVDLSVEDGGVWQCLVKDEVRSPDSWTEQVEVTVALPYSLSLMLMPSQQQQHYGPIVLERGGSAAATGGGGADSSSPPPPPRVEEVVCVARGEGGVGPVLAWQLDGMEVEAAKTKKREETHPDGYKLVYLSLSLSGMDSMFQHHSKLRCLSKQFFPNGSIIYESSVSSDIHILEDLPEPDNINSEMQQASGGRIAGGVITSIIVLILLVALGLLCFAQKKKKWCYANDEKKKVAAARANLLADEDRQSPERGEGGRQATDRASLLLDLYDPNVDSHEVTSQQAPPPPPLQASPEPETPPLPPPSAPPIEDDTDNQFFRRDSSSSPRRPSLSSDQDRLTELINAPPTVPENLNRRSNPEITFRSFSVPSSSSRKALSESLTTPRTSQVRRSNEYVKVRPNTLTSSVAELIGEEQAQGGEGDGPDGGSGSSSSDEEGDVASNIERGGEEEVPVTVHNEMSFDGRRATASEPVTASPPNTTTTPVVLDDQATESRISALRNLYTPPPSGAPHDRHSLDNPAAAATAAAGKADSAGEPRLRQKGSVPPVRESQSLETPKARPGISETAL